MRRTGEPAATAVLERVADIEKEAWLGAAGQARILLRCLTRLAEIAGVAERPERLGTGQAIGMPHLGHV
jgi:hypothetical protein